MCVYVLYISTHTICTSIYVNLYSTPVCMHGYIAHILYTYSMHVYV